MATGGPRYMLHGGYVFDQVAEGDTEVHTTFLQILRELWKAPVNSLRVDVQRAREMAEDNRYIASLDSVMVNYIILEGPPGHVLLIDALWVPDV